MALDEAGDQATIAGQNIFAGEVTSDRERMGVTPVWKRTLDLIGASILVVTFSPVLLVAAFLVRVTSPGPVIFRQARIGLNQRSFTILKFRTMSGSRDHAADREIYRRELLQGESANGSLFLYRNLRYTPIGKVLRRYSIDELPQLFNVLKGDMSLVGPRPAVPFEAELFTPEQQRRHLTLPGITGLWQVSGRNQLSAKDMLKLDIRYVERRSFLFDLWILMKTPRAVLIDRLTG